MIPLRDANPTRRFAWVTLLFIAANVAVFVFWQPTFGTSEEQQVFYFCNAEIPWEVSHQQPLADGGASAREAIEETYDVDPSEATALQQELDRRCDGKSWWQSIFVAMFLHGSWLHIGGNMLYLWIFGNNVEDRIGFVGYAIFYLLGGLAAAALQLVFDPNAAVPNLGASGAVAGILGTYIVMFPRARVYTLIFFFFITAVELPAVLVLGVWFILQLFSGTAGEFGEQAAGGVAYWAHVGGFVFGMAAAWLLFRTRREPPPAFSAPPRPDYFD